MVTGSTCDFFFVFARLLMLEINNTKLNKIPINNILIFVVQNMKSKIKPEKVGRQSLGVSRILHSSIAHCWESLRRAQLVVQSKGQDKGRSLGAAWEWSRGSGAAAARAQALGLELSCHHRRLLIWPSVACVYCLLKTKYCIYLCRTQTCKILPAKCVWSCWEEFASIPHASHRRVLLTEVSCPEVVSSDKICIDLTFLACLAPVKCISSTLWPEKSMLHISHRKTSWKLQLGWIWGLVTGVDGRTWFFLVGSFPRMLSMTALVTGSAE